MTPTNNPDRLMGLAERVEAASGPNFALEQEIGAAVAPLYNGRFYPAYTASLDRALELVPEENLYTLRFQTQAGLRICAAFFDKNGLGSGGVGSTRALALTAAALRALAMKEGSAGS